MKVFVAGASGVIGRPLVRQLVAAGHEVTGMTRREEAAAEIRGAGADAVVCDSFDREAVRAAVVKARPEAVVNQLTSLPREYDPRTIDYEPTNRVRTEGGANLVQAARDAAARRFVTQSIAFLYAPEGGWVKDEGARPFTEAPGSFGLGIESMLAHERAVLDAPDLEGVVLRYGWFYGPGTYFARDGSIAAQVRKRRFPIVGSGEGRNSFVHIEDAAAATVIACERGEPGVYNIVDDEPAPAGEWLPVFADAIGAKRPWRIPEWLAGLIVGRGIARMSTRLRGAANAKARRELGWEPRYPSWRQGFLEALG